MCDNCGCGQTHDHPDDSSSSHRVVDLQQDVLAHDRACANRLRAKLDGMGARLVNIIGSPGCGKTQLLSELIPKLSPQVKCVVVEGDLATDNDARRIRETGAPAFQVMTGTACHLSAHDVEHAIEHLGVVDDSLVLVENVGNLVCPSMFYLGESLRIVCLSVTEGTDKPIKYPVSFRDADLSVITKVDLLEHVDFDLTGCLRMIDDIKPGMPTVVTSARNGDGLDALVAHLLGLWKK